MLRRRRGGKLDRERSIHRLIRPAKSELFLSSSSLFNGEERESFIRLIVRSETIFGYFFLYHRVI